MKEIRFNQINNYKKEEVEFLNCKNDVYDQDLTFLKDYPNLKKIILSSYAEKIELPPSIEIVIAAKCCLKNLKLFENLPNLKKLDISENINIDLYSHKIPQSVTDLNCKDCYIENYDFTKDLPNLKVLDISKNYKVQDIYLSPSLTEFVAVDVEFDNFDFLESLVNLEKLNLSKVYIGDKLGKLKLSTKINELKVNECNITDFSFVQSLINLKVFHMNHNPYSNISNCIVPFKVTDYQCISCYIKDFSFLKPLVNLKKLNITDNMGSNIKRNMLSKYLTITCDPKDILDHSYYDVPIRIIMEGDYPDEIYESIY